MKVTIKRLLSKQLGAPFPGPGKSRIIGVGVTPVFQRPAISRVVQSPFKNVTVIFRLNQHPLGKTWRFRAAKADVFAIMKTLYTSQLPVYNTQLQGEFPMPTGKHSSTMRTVLIAGLDHDDALQVPWKRLSRTPENETKLWTLLTYKYVNPRFG